MTTSPTEIARFETITASERAIERNAETLVWAMAEEGRWASTLVEDQDFWSKRGIVSGIDLERNLVASGISDSFKDHHGIRPRFFNFDAMTLSEMEDVLTSLLSTPTIREEEWEAEEADMARMDAQDAAVAEEDLWWALQDRLEGGRA